MLNRVYGNASLTTCGTTKGLWLKAPATLTGLLHIRHEILSVLAGRGGGRSSQITAIGSLALLKQTKSRVS